MSYIWLTDKEEIKILEAILAFLKDSTNILGIQDGPLPLYKILDYFVTDIPLLKTLRIETENSYADIISSEKTADLYEEISQTLAATVSKMKKDEKKDFLSGIHPKKQK